MSCEDASLHEQEHFFIMTKIQRKSEDSRQVRAWPNTCIVFAHGILMIYLLFRRANTFSS